MNNSDKSELRFSFCYFMKGKKMKLRGNLIVLTGPDGCGKKTQTQLLVNRLKASDYTAETIDFPQYEKKFLWSGCRRLFGG